jgi:hypothetical protein
VKERENAKVGNPFLSVYSVRHILGQGATSGSEYFGENLSLPRFAPALPTLRRPGLPIAREASCGAALAAVNSIEQGCRVKKWAHKTVLGAFAPLSTVYL